MPKLKYIIKTICFIFLILFGVFMIVYGEYDDSPGGQGLGLLAVIIGIIAIVKVRKKFNAENK